MRKLVNTALVYSILGMIGGIFYREFTKWNSFTGNTVLSSLHTHLFALGTFFFLIVLCLEYEFYLRQDKSFNKFYIIYQVGLVITTIMIIVRGIIETINLRISNAMSMTIGGIAGVGHLLLGIAIILFFLILKNRIRQQGEDQN